jgi:serine/threonine-protein kinase HipA
LAVNELLGNPDMHLKNIGLLYADARTPQLSPAYDVVGYAAYSKVTGHALLILPTRLLPRQAQPAAGEAPPKQQLSPAVVRTFCAELGIPEKPAMAAIQSVVRRASEHWPKMLADSNLTSAQKQRLTAHVLGHRMVQSIQRKRPAK